MPNRVEKCPLCKKISLPEFAPFCSQGCKDRDLINWLDGGYAMPVRNDEEDRDSGLDIEG
jgi:uncharacterized protein